LEIPVVNETINHPTVLCQKKQQAKAGNWLPLDPDASGAQKPFFWT
jgi:hypothetical protein